ncbi:MAG: SRPBCC family protein [Rhodobacteraceae bacterium]|nr:SRPBCC family protein [Paracoccaceae bacterium]
MTLPEQVSASRTIVIQAPVEKVFALATDIGNQGAWRSDIAHVDLSQDGTSWVETTSQGIKIAFREQEKQQGIYIITYESPQGFTGHWEGRFTPRQHHRNNPDRGAYRARHGTNFCTRRGAY